MLHPAWWCRDDALRALLLQHHEHLLLHGHLPLLELIHGLPPHLGNEGISYHLGFKHLESHQQTMKRQDLILN